MISEHVLSCDVLVAGGGPAGIACALAASRHGARVILCQDRHVLGGNASNEVRMHIVGATGLPDGLPLQVENREGGIIEELRLELAVRNPQRSPSMMDLILYEKGRAEPLNTTIVAAEVDDGAIRRVTAERPSTEDLFFHHRPRLRRLHRRRAPGSRGRRAVLPWPGGPHRVRRDPRRRGRPVGAGVVRFPAGQAQEPPLRRPAILTGQDVVGSSSTGRR